MPKSRDPQWLADVRSPGPNGKTFHVEPHESFQLHLMAGGGLMEDSVDVSTFTAGVQAYAGYWNGSYANMTAVRAYAAAHNARSFSYTINASGSPYGHGADAIDIEPGDAVPADAPTFYNNGGRNFYASASTTQTVINALASAGIGRDSYNIISAHYIGEHMCGKSTCGYPNADATQFTDAYLGRNLDCTLYSATFFAAAPPGPPPTVTTEDEEMNILPGQASPPVGKSFDSANQYTTMGILGDPSIVGQTQTQIRVAFHIVGGGWSVVNPVTVTSGVKTVLSVPSNTDGVSVTRLDDVPVTLVPNFH